jgi:hypothetical protein
MPLPLIVIAPTILMFAIGIIVFLRGAGYSFDLRKRKLSVAKDRRRLSMDDTDESAQRSS